MYVLPNKSQQMKANYSKNVSKAQTVPAKKCYNCNSLFSPTYFVIIHENTPKHDAKVYKQILHETLVDWVDLKTTEEDISPIIFADTSHPT